MDVVGVRVRTRVGPPLGRRAGVGPDLPVPDDVHHAEAAGVVPHPAVRADRGEPGGERVPSGLLGRVGDTESPVQRSPFLVLARAGDRAGPAGGGPATDPVVGDDPVSY